LTERPIDILGDGFLCPAEHHSFGLATCPANGVWVASFGWRHATAAAAVAADAAGSWNTKCLMSQLTSVLLNLPANNHTPWLVNTLHSSRTHIQSLYEEKDLHIYEFFSDLLFNTRYSHTCTVFIHSFIQSFLLTRKAVIQC